MKVRTKKQNLRLEDELNRNSEAFSCMFWEPLSVDLSSNNDVPPFIQIHERQNSIDSFVPILVLSYATIGSETDCFECR